MALTLTDKQAIVAEVSQVAKQSISVVAAVNKGLTVSEMTELRAKARTSGVYLRVVRNTLARRALKETEFECIQDSLVGPIVLGFAKNEPGSAAKLFRDFVKGRENIEVKAVALGGQLYSAKQLDAVANLPSREEALSQLAAALLAPATKLLRLLSEPHTKLARALDASKDKKSE